VKGGVITPAAAIALMQIVAPAVPLHMVQQAINGSTPQPGDAPVALDTKNVSPIPPTPLPDIHIHAPSNDGAANKSPGMMSTVRDAAPPLPHMSPEPMNPRMHP